MENKKYELTNDTINVGGHILHRIKALKSFGNIMCGEIGGFIESEENLSYEGLCWVSDSAVVCDNARVYGDARICGYAEVSDSTQVFGNARVSDNAWVSDSTQVFFTCCMGCGKCV